jgi:Uma2 family endonuclease
MYATDAARGRQGVMEGSRDALPVVTAHARRASVGAMQDLVFESTRTVTQEEFAAWVDWRARMGDVSHYELLQGRVVMTPPAGYPHGEIESNIHLRLASHVAAQRLGKVFGSSQGFELGTKSTVEPDLSFVSKERWEAAPTPVPGKFLRVVPDLIVEILSPSTSKYDREGKKAIYARAGVREYWIVDGGARQVQVFRLGEAEPARYGREQVFTAGDQAPSGAVPGWVVRVGELFP